MDIFSRLFGSYVDWIDRLDFETDMFVFRSVLVLGLPTLICGYAFYRGNRHLPLQWMIYTASLILALAIPVNELRIYSAFWKTVTFSLIVTALVFLPSILPIFLFKTEQSQKRLRLLFYGLLILMLLVN